MTRRTVRVAIGLRPELADPRGAALIQAAATLGIAVARARVHDVYWLDGEGDLEGFLARAALDAVVEVLEPAVDGPYVEVALRPGVTDPIAATLVEAAGFLGFDGLRRAATGRRWVVEADDLAGLATRLLANGVIERFAVDRPLAPAFAEGVADPHPHAAEVVVRALDDAALVALSQARRLALDRDEMRAIAAHFEALGREPTDLELEMLAQTWSEHCVHKTFRARITMEDRASDRRFEVDGLLKSFIRRATEAIAAPWVRSAFVDNAGIVAYDDRLDVAIKVETHNRPSALEPFGGANTGLGGVIRDVLGVSARPIAGIDVLCFGPPDLPAAELLPGVLHPRRIRDGVVHGIEDYGNKMGIPTVAGAIVYHPSFVTNPLVFAGCVGVVPRGGHPTRPEAGDLVVVLGGLTGRDGLRGATFSSLTMDAATGEVSGGAVQIGNPITEKQVLEVVVRARDLGLYHAITDCGAGGLSSAVGEMGKELGARVDLARVPLKYAGLLPWEVWLSEAQERMVLAVPEASLPALAALAEEHEAPLAVIGTFTGDGVVEVVWGDVVVGRLDAGFLHDGLPRRHLQAVWEAPAPRAWPPPEEAIGAGLLARLASLDTRSREDVIRRYDHEVQGGTVIRPLVGPGRGPSDAAVIVPFDAVGDAGADARRGLAIGIGVDPALGLRDPYVMAWSVIDEAIRNVVAVGADPDEVSILDNFSWGDARLPDRLGALVRACEGCHDAAVHYGAPFVSGKDSLNNEWTAPDGTRRAIPPTLVVTAIAPVPDVGRAIGSDLVAAGHALYVVGETTDADVVAPPRAARDRYRALHAAIRKGLVQSAHDASEGGLAVALAEMVIGGRLGARVDLAAAAPGLRPDRAAFAECPGRLVVAVAPEDVETFEREVPAAVRIGVVTDAAALVLGEVALGIEALTAAWRGAGG
ncbi:MAG: phosphoribosylformylglycinamidine synthase [Deltaproteobacteria bacterium]|nr:phosphoribosylformylglycinamidine synthase [Deltaproteobacteria bacterium]